MRYLLARGLRVIAALPILVGSLLAPAGAFAASSPLHPFFKQPDVAAASVSLWVNGVPLWQMRPGDVHSTASTAKIMTAYVILKLRPFALKRTVRVTRTEVLGTKRSLKQNNWVMSLKAGQTYTGWQLLNAALVRSYDNAANMLADETPGGRAHFVALMNAEAKRLGLTHTHFVDPSGVSPKDVSTAADMTRLAEDAMALPSFRAIVAQKYVQVPYHGRLRNVDLLMFRSPYVIGIKTGWTPEAGPSIVFAAQRKVAGKMINVSGTIYHAASWKRMYIDALGLINASLDSAQAGLGMESRRDFVVGLAQRLGLNPLNRAAPVFTDVAPGSSGYGYIEAAAKAGWLQGFPGHRFQGNLPLTRDEAAKMEVLALGLGNKVTTVKVSSMRYKDRSKIPVWAQKYVAEASSVGLYRGFPDGTFRPTAPLSAMTGLDALSAFRVVAGTVVKGSTTVAAQ